MHVLAQIFRLGYDSAVCTSLCVAAYHHCMSLLVCCGVCLMLDTSQPVLLHCLPLAALSADSCPVSCIHWVQREELPALEYVMQNRVDRVNVGVMMAGQGRVADVFAATASFMKERKRKEEEALRAKRKYSPAQEEARRWVY